MAEAAESLFQAIESGDLDEVRALVAEDPSLAAARNADGLSAVLAATYQHRGDIAEVLLAAAPELDVFDAAAVGETTRLAALLEAEPEAANAFAADGFTPLSLAAFFAQPGAVRLLVGRGADVGAAARNAMAVQPLHAAVAGRDFASASVLLGAGADPNARQHGGWTPLMAAAAHGDREIVEVLLAAGADPEIANDEGKTAAFLAEEGGHKALAQQLRGVSLRP